MLELVKEFQKNCAYNPPNKFSGSVLDGRDITSVIMKDAMFKFYITASLNIRAKRRLLEFNKAYFLSLFIVVAIKISESNWGLGISLFFKISEPFFIAKSIFIF